MSDHVLTELVDPIGDLEAGARELLIMVEEDARIVALGRTPMLLAWTASMLEGRDPDEGWFTGSSERYVHAAFSGTKELFADADVAPYRKYLEKVGLDPISILNALNEGRRTVIVDWINNGDLMSEFLNIIIDWAEELEQKGKLKSVRRLTRALYIIDLGDGFIRKKETIARGNKKRFRAQPGWVFPLHYLSVTEGLPFYLANINYNEDLMGFYFPPRSWDEDNPTEALESFKTNDILKDLNLLRFWVIDNILGKTKRARAAPGKRRPAGARRKRKSPSGRPRSDAAGDKELMPLDDEFTAYMDFSATTNAVYKSDVFMQLLRHSTRDVKKVNDMAVALSEETGQPVLLVAVERAGLPYSWAIDDWRSQLDDAQDAGIFEAEIEDLAASQKISNEEAEFRVAQRWIDEGKIGWYVSVISEHIPSAATDLTSQWSRRLEKKWAEAINNTSLNLIFVDDTNRKPRDPNSFAFIRGIMLHHMPRTADRETANYTYFDAENPGEVKWDKDKCNVLFMKPARKIPDALIGRYPETRKSSTDRIYYVWWDNVDTLFGHRSQVGRHAFVAIRTNIGDMYLHHFMELKFKELTGWFERNKTDLLSYAESNRYIIGSTDAPDGTRASQGRRSRKSPSGTKGSPERSRRAEEKARAHQPGMELLREHELGRSEESFFEPIIGILYRVFANLSFIDIDYVTMWIPSIQFPPDRYVLRRIYNIEISGIERLRQEGERTKYSPRRELHYMYLPQYGNRHMQEPEPGDVWIAVKTDYLNRLDRTARDTFYFGGDTGQFGSLSIVRDIPADEIAAIFLYPEYYDAYVKRYGENEKVHRFSSEAPAVAQIEALGFLMPSPSWLSEIFFRKFVTAILGELRTCSPEKRYTDVGDGTAAEKRIRFLGSLKKHLPNEHFDGFKIRARGLISRLIEEEEAERRRLSPNSERPGSQDDASRRRSPSGVDVEIPMPDMYKNRWIAESLGAAPFRQRDYEPLVRYISHDEFVERLRTIVLALNEKLKGYGTYGVLWDENAHSSKRWVYSLAAQWLDKPPAATAYATDAGWEKLKDCDIIVVLDDIITLGLDMWETGKFVHERDPSKELCFAVPCVGDTKIFGKFREVLSNIQRGFELIGDDESDPLYLMLGNTLPILDHKIPDLAKTYTVSMAVDPSLEPYKVPGTAYYEQEEYDFALQEAGQSDDAPDGKAQKRRSPSGEPLLPLFIDEETMLAAEFQTREASRGYPYYLLPEAFDRKKVMLKNSVFSGEIETLFLATRAAYEIAHAVNFEYMPGAQIYAGRTVDPKFADRSAHQACVVQDFFGESIGLKDDLGSALEESLSITYLYSKPISDEALEARSEAYSALADQEFGMSFVCGDIFRLICGNVGDSHFRSNIRISEDRKELQWIDFNLAFSKESPDIHERVNSELLRYLKSRYKPLVQHGLGLIEALAELPDDRITAIADNVYGEEMAVRIAAVFGDADKWKYALSVRREWLLDKVRRRKETFHRFLEWLKAEKAGELKTLAPKPSPADGPHRPRRRSPSGEPELRAAYTEHRSDPARNIVRRAPEATVDGALRVLVNMREKHGCAIAGDMEEKLRNLYTDPAKAIHVNKADAVIEIEGRLSCINVIDHPDFTRSTSGGMGINISMAEVRKMAEAEKMEKDDCMSALIIRQTIEGCVSGEPESVRQLADIVALNSKEIYAQHASYVLNSAVNNNPALPGLPTVQKWEDVISLAENSSLVDYDDTIGAQNMQHPFRFVGSPQLGNNIRNREVSSFSYEIAWDIFERSAKYVTRNYWTQEFAPNKTLIGFELLPETMKKYKLPVQEKPWHSRPVPLNEVYRAWILSTGTEEEFIDHKVRLIQVIVPGMRELTIAPAAVWQMDDETTADRIEPANDAPDESRRPRRRSPSGDPDQPPGAIIPWYVAGADRVGFRSAQFESQEEFTDFIKGCKSVKTVHPEGGGGTHFTTHLLPEISLVEKVPHNNREIMESVMLAKDRLGGACAEFIIVDIDGTPHIYMESMVSLQVVIEEFVRKGKFEELERYLRKFFEANIALIRRGVINWDPKIENFGVNKRGEVVVIDIGGLAPAELALDEYDLATDDSALEFFFLKIHDLMPKGVSEIFYRLAHEYRLDNGSTIFNTVETNINTEPPVPIEWVPEIAVTEKIHAEITAMRAERKRRKSPSGDPAPGYRDVQFRDEDELAEFIAQNKPVSAFHSDRVGGAHFTVRQCEGMSLVEKTPHSEEVMKSVALAKERLGGICAGFTVVGTGKDALVYMESVVSLKNLLKELVQSSRFEEAEKYLRQYFEVSIETMRRGAMNWDPKVENYGVNGNGEVVLLDIGGLVPTEDALDEYELSAHSSSLEYFYLKLKDGLPAGLAKIFNRLMDEYGLGTGTAVYNTIKQNCNTGTPQRLEWTPVLSVSEDMHAAIAAFRSGRTDDGPNPKRRSPSGIDDRIAEFKRLYTSALGQVENLYVYSRDPKGEKVAEEDLEREIEVVAKEAIAASETAKRFSRVAKRPILVVGLDSVGTPYVAAIEDPLDKLAPERREVFKQKVSAQMQSLGKAAHADIIARFTVAREFMATGEMEWFVHPVLERISSRGTYVQAQRFIEEYRGVLMATDPGVLFVDSSCYNIYPESFDLIAKGFSLHNSKGNGIEFRWRRGLLIPEDMVTDDNFNRRTMEPALISDDMFEALSAEAPDKNKRIPCVFLNPVPSTWHAPAGSFCIAWHDDEMSEGKALESVLASFGDKDIFNASVKQAADRLRAQGWDLKTGLREEVNAMRSKLDADKRRRSPSGDPNAKDRGEWGEELLFLERIGEKARLLRTAVDEIAECLDAQDPDRIQLEELLRKASGTVREFWNDYPSSKLSTPQTLLKELASHIAQFTAISDEAIDTLTDFTEPDDLVKEARLSMGNLILCIEAIEAILERADLVRKHGLLSYFYESESMIPVNLYIDSGEQTDEFKAILRAESLEGVDWDLKHDAAETKKPRRRSPSGDRSANTAAPIDPDLIFLPEDAMRDAEFLRGTEGHRKYPVYKLPDRYGGKESVAKYSSHVLDLQSVLNARAAYEIARAVEYEYILPAHIYVGKVLTPHATTATILQDHFGTAVDQELNSPIFNALEIRRGSEGDGAGDYAALAGRDFGISFVRGDIFRIFCNYAGDSYASYHLRMSEDKTEIRWVDFDRAFSWGKDVGKNAFFYDEPDEEALVLGYLKSRYRDMVRYGLDLIVLLSTIDARLEEISERVYGKKMREGLVGQADNRELFQKHMDSTREEFESIVQKRCDPMREFLEWLITEKRSEIEGAIKTSPVRSVRELHIDDVEQRLTDSASREQSPHEKSPAISDRRRRSPSGTECLMAVKQDEGLFADARSEDGISAAELALSENFDRPAVEKTLGALADSGVLERVEGEKDRFRFSDMMFGPDGNHTGTLTNVLCYAGFRFGQNGEEPLLNQADLQDDKAPVVRELVKMTILNEMNNMIAPRIPKEATLWHIVENDLLADCQKGSFAQQINKVSRESEGNEKIYITRPGETIRNAILTIKAEHFGAIFDVALADRANIGLIPDNIDVKMLILEGNTGDLTQLEGIIAALRALRLRKDLILPTLRRIYAVLGAIPQVAVSDEELIGLLDDPEEFALNFIYRLPPSEAMPFEDLPRVRERLRQLIIAA
ncbi:hypothetical protein ACFL42_02560 [Candidatus Omnitrophota bacterium]